MLYNFESNVSLFILDDLEHYVDLLTKDIEIPKGDTTGKFIILSNHFYQRSPAMYSEEFSKIINSQKPIMKRSPFRRSSFSLI